MLALVLAQARLAAENQALSEKTKLLLRELTHRTKNNNQMLMSMICLHRMKTAAPEAQRALESFENRIRLMAAIDEMLALDEETDSIDVPLFLGAVAGKAFAAMTDKRRETRLVLELQDGDVQPQAGPGPGHHRQRVHHQQLQIRLRQRRQAVGQRQLRA